MGSQSAKKEIKELVREMTRSGWTYEKCRKNSKLRHPSGHIVSFSNTPGAMFAANEIRRDIKRLLARIEGG